MLLLPGCSDDKIIEQDKLVLVYTDLLIIQDTVSSKDKSLDSLRNSVFSGYNVTQEEYENTIKYYNEDIIRWEVFFDKVTSHLDSLSRKSSPEEVPL